MTDRILVVDDEANTLTTLRRALELEGFEITTASSLVEARGMLHERPDACLLDVRLPDGNGIDFLAEIARIDAALPVIIMSGHATIDDAVRATRLGARDVLEKPISQDRLFLTLKNVLELSRLVRENAQLKEDGLGASNRQTMLGRSPAILGLLEEIGRVADSEGRVLITGENGSGKELVARAIHAASRRKDQPFVSLNAASVPAELIESELFGHEKGAFTGAFRQKVGKFERAHRGTLFLDEVGDMPLSMQAKLLRVLEVHEVERVGGGEPVKVDVRTLSATNKDLVAEVRAGRFREDLYYRLNVVPIHVPPLRERKSDIPVLVDAFLKDSAARNHRPVPKLSDRAMSLFSSHDYPGNVRELKNLVERVVILSKPSEDMLTDAEVAKLLPMTKQSQSTAPLYRDGARLVDLVLDAERAIVVAALEAHGGVAAEAARALGVERSNFHKKLKALGLRS